MLNPGTYLQDRYEILEQIGAGGMSYVYKARCHTLNRLVAIKVLKEEFAFDAEFVEKFKMEARSAARLSHPNIVSIYDVVDEGPLHYIVMELIEGITLKQYITKKGHLETKEAIGIAIQVAQGIGAAHSQHIIHRDIKPQNMIIAMDGKVKVADFGIARAVSAQTMNAQAVGSVHYISPEQAKGEFCDERSDIYSFGITMFEMVTGQVPFEADTAVSVALAHLEDPIPLPSSLNPDVGTAMEQIIIKCTQKRPERRYASMNDVIADLRRALLNPQTDLYQEEERRDDFGQTRTMSPEEMNRIQDAGRRQSVSREEEEEYLEEEDEDEEEEEPPIQEAPKHSKSRNIRVRRKAKPSSDEDVTLQFEQILAIIRIVVAVLVVVVVVFVFATLGRGFMNSGSGRLQEEVDETTVPQTQTEVVSITDDQTQVPDLLGSTLEEARVQLDQYGLVLAQPVNEDYSDTYEKGEIMSQSPGSEEKAAKGTSVTVTVSLGSDTLDLASLNLTSMTGSAAVSLLEGMDMDLDVETRQESSDTVPANMVIRTVPADEVKAQEMVVLYISTGPAVVQGQVPNLMGKTQEEAEALLEAAGLVLGNVSSQYQEGAAAGTVILQSELENTILTPGSAVDITICAEAEETQEASDERYYLGSIDETCSLASYIGPATQTSSVRVSIRLKQQVGENQYDYQTLIQPHLVVGAQTIPVSISRIKGHWGVDTGEVEVVDASNNVVIQSYTISFFPAE